jgi:D-alanyl-D-alanine carboxypeptidase
MSLTELHAYVRRSSKLGKTRDEIRASLLEAGWQAADIEHALERMRARGTTKQWTSVVLAALVVIFGGTTFYLWHERINLADTNDKQVRDFYTQLAQSQISFTDSGEMVLPDEQKFMDQKAAYIKNKDDFLVADLRAMQLTLYQDGVASTTFPILTKGKEGSWWETPTGDYKILGKSTTAYSSIGNVWMPYSMQFYGNYFIHGWPYHDDGTPVPQGYSGGCIRLATEDAKAAYSFAKVGMPLLVLEDNGTHTFGTLSTHISDPVLPRIHAESFLIADLASGDTITEKEADEALPIGSLANLMTAVVAHEIIYLARSIEVTPQTLASVEGLFTPTEGQHYIGLDLLYPLLMQSSDESAKILASYVGEHTFVHNMNIKASSLQMADTQFANVSGADTGNTSTAHDIEKLLQYIYYKRPFLFDITRGVAFENVGTIKIGDTRPIHDLKDEHAFTEDVDLVGVEGGGSDAEQQTLATVWNIHTATGDVPVAIILLSSPDTKGDTEALLSWVKKNFETPQEN